jgi:hypothetical protein
LQRNSILRRWASYLLVLLLRPKVLWRIWDFKHIAYSDTSSYFLTATGIELSRQGTANSE